MFITTLLNTLGALGEIVGIVKGENADHLLSKLDLIESKGSISKFTSSFVLEPVIIIDSNLETDKKGDIIKYQLRLFTTYILQIFYKSINIDGIEPRIAFELISSNESTISASLHTAKALIGLESNTALENISAKIEVGREAKALTEDLTGAMNFIVDVEFAIQDRTVKMPILIRPKIIYSSMDNITELIEVESRSSLGKSIEDVTLGNRSVWDLISSNSLIEEARKHKFKDSNELLALAKERVNKARTKLKYGALGFQASYCMFIIEDENVSILERDIGGKFDNSRYISEFFEQTSSFIFTSVDTSYETIKTYVEGNKGSTEVDFGELKDKSKGDNSDLLKAFLQEKTLF